MLRYGNSSVWDGAYAISEDFFTRKLISAVRGMCPASENKEVLGLEQLLI